MSVTLHRWGSSVGLRVPKPLIDQLDLGEGSTVEPRIENGRLIIEPERKRRLTMGELLEGIRRMIDLNLWTGDRRLAAKSGKAYLPQGGDLAWINFDPQAGREKAKTRPHWYWQAPTSTRQLDFSWSPQSRALNARGACACSLSVPRPGGCVMIEQSKSVDWSARDAAFLSACRNRCSKT